MDKAPNKVALILRKEWLELRQQRVLLLGMLAPPLIFAVMPLAFASFAGQNLMEEGYRPVRSPAGRMGAQSLHSPSVMHRPLSL